MERKLTTKEIAKEYDMLIKNKKHHGEYQDFACVLVDNKRYFEIYDDSWGYTIYIGFPIAELKKDYKYFKSYYNLKYEYRIEESELKEVMQILMKYYYRAVE